MNSWNLVLFRHIGYILSFCHAELVERLLVYRYSVDIFHVPVLQKYWDFTESRIACKLMQGGVGFLYFP